MSHIMKTADLSTMIQVNPDKLMEWLRLVLTNTNFSRTLPVITSCLSLEQIGELMSAKAAEIKELEKLTHEISNGNIDGRKMDDTNEIPKEEEEEDTQSVILSEEDMAYQKFHEDITEETNDSDDVFNNTKTPENVVVMKAMPTREVAKLKRLEEADEDWHPPAKMDIKEEHEQKSKHKFFKCSECPARFSGHRRSWLLRRHGLVHQGVGSFTCPTCDKVFKRKDKLTEHMRIHTGEKPFSCQHCDYKASSSSLLSHHRKSKRCAGNAH